MHLTAAEPGKGGLRVVARASRTLNQGDAQLPSGLSIPVQLAPRVRVVGIMNEQDSLEAWHDPVKDLEPLGRQLEIVGDHTGEVAARPGIAANKPELYGITTPDDDDRDP